MERTNKKVIAVVGATGQQGGAAVRALQAGDQFKARALTRNPAKHRELAGEVIEADLNRPETVKPAFAGAHGVFLVTNWWEKVPTGSSRQPLRYAPPRMRALSTLSGPRCLMWKRSAAAVPCSSFYRQGQGGSDSERSRVCESYVRYRALLLSELIGVLAPQKQTDGSAAGLCRLIQLCGAFT
jgi:NmrA-like family